ncbi:hypothetical protein PAXRUDRAFT_20753 [Paxillus rubicundulus Ve08.2h10]|uniref:Uncharacterized protein n=1 Tax=Paxillus rubicundulus Ve08.2h10 TaxID=930991 RepID=A0A0D0BPS6_9AGAM|nr:hypothetical protein PAXRUDRAFT_20753 [Paxillus rubicundulus Ve08.2h10]
MSSTSTSTISEFKAFTEKSGVKGWKMAVISINKILDKVQAKYLSNAKVPSVVITAEMQMFLINQVIT